METAAPCPGKPRWWQATLLVAAFWSFIATLFIIHTALLYASFGERVPMARIVALQLVDWLSWAPMTPLVYLLVLRHPLAAGARWKALGVYGAAAIGALVLNAAIVTAGWMAFPWHDKGLVATYGEQLGRLLPIDTFLFMLLVPALHAVLYYGTTRERELESARLKSQLAEARLETLTMQLQPHFLFNTLNTISGLVTLDPPRADRMISRLADLIRMSLRPDRGSLVPLGEELAFIEGYLAIQEARFDERLTVHRRIAAGVDDALVPAFLLQPLIENSIRHAVAPHSAPVRVEVGVERVRDRLRIELRDDGPGLPVADVGQLTEGIGLRNTRVRLQQIYGIDHRFEIRSVPEGGVQVLLDLPWRPQEHP